MKNILNRLVSPITSSRFYKWWAAKPLVCQSQTPYAPAPCGWVAFEAVNLQTTERKDEDGEIVKEQNFATIKLKTGIQRFVEKGRVSPRQSSYQAAERFARENGFQNFEIKSTP